MNKSITNVSLSFCCKEDWNSFKTVDDHSRFCASCQHRVIDFTKATTDDLAHAKSNGSFCGRFKRSQLSAAFMISIAAATSLTSCSDSPIEPPPITPPPIEKINVDEEFELLGVVIPDSLYILNDSTQFDVKGD